jgi:hypothetical protein
MATGFGVPLLVSQQRWSMKTLASICACIALITGIVSVNLWRELRTERQANKELRTQFNAARLPSSAPAIAAPVAANVAPTAVATAAVEAPVCRSDSPPKATQTAATNALQNSLNMQNELMKDPEYRKLRLAQTRLSIERTYSGLAEELGLSDKEADKLFDLLAEHQVATSAEIQLLTAGGNQDQAAMEERARRQQALRREQDEALRAMLGGKYPQYQDYQQTLPARQRVTSMGTQLAQAGLPLSAAQTKSLTTAMVAEQQRQMQEARTVSRTPVNPADPDARAKLLEEQLKRTEDNNRRLVEAAAPHMSASQLAAYRNQMEQQAAMSRITMKMSLEQQRLQSQPQPQPQ